jgi:glutaminyl-peptide cyclotransferase
MNRENRIRIVARTLGGAATVLMLALAQRGGTEEIAGSAQPAKKPVAGAQPTNPLDGQRAFGYLQELCAIGPRPSGSPGMEKQQTLVQKYFEKLGGKVSFQRFLANNPLGGDKVPMANIIVEWHPERKERILLCAHYDTRPFPDNDPDPVQRRSGIFLGANDGASGVAVLMELAHLMPKLSGPLGVDFLLLDGEELVYVEGRDPYFLGSTWFAQQYAQTPPQHKYKWGVLLDMVGDMNLGIYQDRYSATWHETRPLVKAIWGTAGKLGVTEFIPRVAYEVRDDHLPLRNTAKIPTCDIIDFDYPAWHTTRDNPQHCAPSSLAKVGWVVYEWIKSQEAADPHRS